MIQVFREIYGASSDAEIKVFRAPGRVNLIGEHTDYNLGYVLPVALDLACFIACAPSVDGRIRLYSQQRSEFREWPAAEIARLKPRGDWTDYTVGVAQQLLRAGFSIEPKSMLIHSTVPEGSGLSSSAALEVSSALALLGGQNIDALKLAQLCQRAEIEFVGVPCGIMDQYVAVFGKVNAAIEIDCRSLEHKVVELPSGIEILAVNSMVKHELAQSAYRERTEQCAAAVEALRSRYPSVQSLRDASLPQLQTVASSMPGVIARRARHVISENDRVVEFLGACKKESLAEMGRLFLESHRSLQHDYEVSCEELDFLVNTATKIRGVYGARMTGGGFGGCTVNLVQPGAVAEFKAGIAEAYRKRFGITPQIFLCRPSEGAREVGTDENIPPVTN